MMKMGTYFFSLILLISFMLPGCVSTKKDINSKIVYKFKTLNIPMIIEMLSEDQRTQESYKTYKSIAADQVIEESPNVQSVTRVIDMGGKDHVLYPQISPDGSFVVYSKYEKKTGRMNLWKKNINGAGKTRLTNGKYFDIYPTVSDDSKYVFFSSNRAGNFNIWRIKINGAGGLRRVTSHRNNDYAPDISNDGKLLVFHSYSPFDSQPQIWTCTSEGTALTQMRIGKRPKWSHDDNHILYLAPGNEDGIYDIWTMTKEGTCTTQLSSGINVKSASWSPDGRILYSGKNENAIKPNYDIWIGKTQLTTNPSDDNFPMFDKKKRLFFRSNRGFSVDYWMTDPIVTD